MNDTDFAQADGRCTCGLVRYRLNRAPMWVNCCHCTWCQRETGSAFVLNALIESDQLELLASEVEVINTPTASGRGDKGQMISRCPRCKVALWSNYSTAGGAICYVRIGTLDEPWRFRPDAHIFTSAKLPWVTIPDGVLATESHYNRDEVWPKEAYKRFRMAVDSTSG